MAFAITVMVLVGLLQLSTRSVNNSGLSNRQSLATNYANEGMQWVKEQKNILNFEKLKIKCNIGVFPNCTGAYCLNTLGWNTGTCGSSTIGTTEFTRNLAISGSTVTANGITKNQITATVSVTWNESGRSSSSHQTFIFVDR
jgi:hypothetical protein